MSIDPSTIKPAGYNPRKITEEERWGLHNSMNKFDDISGIVFNKRTGRLIGGHHRWDKLKQECDDLKIVHILDEFNAIYDSDNFTGYMIRIVDWDEATEKAANVTANSHTISGKFDLDILPTLLEEIREINPEDFSDLRMDILEKDLKLSFDDWDADPGEIKNTEANTDPLEGTIKIRYPQSAKEEVIEFIGDILKACPIEGVYAE